MKKRRRGVSNIFYLKVITETQAEYEEVTREKVSRGGVAPSQRKG